MTPSDDFKIWQYEVKSQISNLLQSKSKSHTISKDLDKIMFKKHKTLSNLTSQLIFIQNQERKGVVGIPLEQVNWFIHIHPDTISLEDDIGSERQDLLYFEK